MDIDTKFLEDLKFPDAKKLFEASLDMTLNRNQTNNPRLLKYKDFSYDEKLKITKIYEFLNKAAFAIKNKGEYGIDGLMSQLEKIPQKDQKFIVEVIKAIEFNKSLNNYKLLQKSGTQGSKKILEQKKNEVAVLEGVNDFVKLEWRVEIILSSIAMKKVLKPMVLFSIYTKQGRKSFYVDVNQFQEIRKNFALILKQIHQIEFKG